MVSGEELFELVKREIPKFYIPTLSSEAPESTASRFLRSFGAHIKFNFRVDGGGIALATLDGFDNNSQASKGKSIEFQINQSNEIGATSLSSHVDVSQLLPWHLANIMKGRIYAFDAERLNISQSEMGNDPNLASDASNLPKVLDFLQGDNPPRFDRFNRYISTIFPEIKKVTIRSISSNRKEIWVWTVDPDLERSDLAFPLSESGTGLGQVMAMLYVALNSNNPRTIIIDEPQSFLHPGAVRKLFEILKRQPQEHQYIVTTHSPTAVTAADPQSLLLVRKKGAESKVEVINVGETQKLRLFLSEVGARLSDVFGADDILWVEGATEERCFPLILSQIAMQPLMGTVILAVIHTGDFEGRHSDTIFEIYDRLSKGRGLLPPAIGFIFDQEGRSQTEQDDLRRRSGQTITFLPRRMYENYLLNSHAITWLLNTMDTTRKQQVTAEEVEEWLTSNRLDKKYFLPDEIDQNPESWIENIHGAKVLKDLFNDLTDGRVPYEKVEYGVALTQWVIENSPQDLEELPQFLKGILTRGVESTANSQ